MTNRPRIARVELNIDGRVRRAEILEPRDEQLVGEQRGCTHAQRLPAIAARELRERPVESLEQRLDLPQQSQAGRCQLERARAPLEQSQAEDRLELSHLVADGRGRQAKLVSRELEAQLPRGHAERPQVLHGRGSGEAHRRTTMGCCRLEEASSVPHLNSSAGADRCRSWGMRPVAVQVLRTSAPGRCEQQLESQVPREAASVLDEAWNSGTTTSSWASSAPPARTRSRLRIGASRASTIPMSARNRMPKRASRKCRKRTRCCATRRSARPTTSWGASGSRASPFTRRRTGAAVSSSPGALPGPAARGAARQARPLAAAELPTRTSAIFSRRCSAAARLLRERRAAAADETTTRASTSAWR